MTWTPSSRPRMFALLGWCGLPALAGSIALALTGCSGQATSDRPVGGTGSSASGASAGADMSGSPASGTVAASAGSGAIGASGGAAAGSGSAGSGAASSGTSSGPVTLPTSGPSVGCGKPPGRDNSLGPTLHTLAIPACGANPVTPDCIAPAFSPGGAAYQSNGAWDFSHRNYSVQLPASYDPSTPYPVMVGAGGCGQGPTDASGGFSGGETGAIIVGLSYVQMCFADGGTSCAGTVANEPLCVNTPEVPFFRAMLADLESKFCVDQGKVFLGGYSSGAWDTLTLGCALSNVIRGTVTLEGGLRLHRPACSGPEAALFVVGQADTVNPIGPLMSIDAMLDSYGSAPARDDLLARNGCAGMATMPYDPNYPACVTYTGCPAAYPVVWCPLPGVGHADSLYNGVDYSPGSVAGDSLYWNFLTRLPAR